jgi:hypothetical protein
MTDCVLQRGPNGRHHRLDAAVAEIEIGAAYDDLVRVLFLVSVLPEITYYRSHESNETSGLVESRVFFEPPVELLEHRMKWIRVDHTDEYLLSDSWTQPQGLSLLQRFLETRGNANYVRSRGKLLEQALPQDLKYLSRGLVDWCQINSDTTELVVEIVSRGLD